MAKLRHNHQAKKGFGKGTIRIVMVLVLLAGLLVMGPFFYMELFEGMDEPEPELSSDRFYIPQGGNGQLVHHSFYSLSYNEDREQANWVAYPLTRDLIKMPNVPRTDWFEVDPKVRTGSAHHRDYKGSGYTRGHMAPAGDMAFDKLAMDESFYMSNMSPQLRAFNNGIWRELEENVRDWTYKKDKVYIVSGPIFGTSRKEIGKIGIDVPAAFYKIILNQNLNEVIAYLIPHEKTNKPLSDFIVSIDQIEAETGLDFFDLLLDDTQEDELESALGKGNWAFDQSKFKQRVERWNNQ